MITNLDKFNIKEMSAQTLAFIGDAILSLYIRLYLAQKSSEQTGKLHRKSTRYVSAKAQSYILKEIMGILTDEEIEVYKRGRNANLATVPKNVDVITYKEATGYEALIGYIYIKQDNERIDFLITKSIELIEEKNKE